MTTINAQISTQILSRVITGQKLPDAVDAVLGEGTYRNIADEVYDELRARGEAASHGMLLTRDGFEYFERWGNVFKAHLSEAVMPDGYRCGRFEIRRSQWDRHPIHQSR